MHDSVIRYSEVLAVNLGGVEEKKKKRSGVRKTKRKEPRTENHERTRVKKRRKEKG
jgi:hypothetical protein